MFIIGVTGSFGTGKTTVAKIFAGFGAKVIDADKIVHQLMRKGGPCYRPIVRLFGKEILTKGEIDRKKLATIVFNDPRRLKKLCNIIHPLVVKEIKKNISRFRKIKRIRAVIIDAPLLIEADLHKIVDYLVVVKANRKLQIKRILRRARITKGQIMKRIKSQLPMREKIRLADIIIDNRGNLTRTKNEVGKIWQRLSKRK